MKVYCAGPMRGYPEFNFPAFIAATAELRAQGFEVFNPAERDIDAGFAYQGLAGTMDELAEHDFDLRSALGADLAWITAEADAIVVLPGWERSSGARAEVATGRALGLRIFEYTGAPSTGVSWLRELDVTPAATIVALCGYAQAGKDTVGSILVERHGFERLAFADALRDMLYALNPLTETHDWPWSRRVQAIVDQLGWEWAKQHTGVRELLQRLGTEAGRRVLGENIWVDTCLAKIKPGGRYVITDCRFPNEADAVKALGGRVVRVERPGFGPVNGHPSETALDDHPYDVVIKNVGLLEDLEAEVATVVPA